MMHNVLDSARLCGHITRRNWAVYRKDLFANISPSLADPALIMVSLGLGLGSYLSNVNGMPYMNFLAPGLTVATTLFTSFFETSYGFYVRMTFENVFKAMLTTPIGPAEVVMGELVWVGLKGLVMALGVSLVLACFGLASQPLLLPLVGLMGFLVGVACGAIGLISSGLIRNINQFQTVYSFLIAPLYFLSGIFFPIEQLWTPLRWLAEVFPLIHGVRMAQALFWNVEVVHTLALHGGIVLVQALVFGSIAYRVIHRKLVA
jgi:lipooligosaccharide transport system permease protein